MAVTATVAAAATTPPVDTQALKIGQSVHFRHPRLYHYNSQAGDVLLLAAFALALTYGLVFFRRSPGPLRTAVKTGAVAALAGVSWCNGEPLLLTLGLAFCALGDAFLAGDPKRWLPPGLASFLLGHLTYVALFVTSLSTVSRDFSDFRAPGTLAPGLPQIGAMVATVLVALVVLAWLWRSLGTLRWAVCAYVLAIVAMVCASLALPWVFDGAQYGALLFFASDGVLSAQLFKQRFTGLLGQWIVWGCYFLGQVLIVMAFSPLTG